MGDRFDCRPDVRQLLASLHAIDTPQLPNEPIDVVLAPIDQLLDQIEDTPVLIELVAAIVRLAHDVAPRTAPAEGLLRAAMWTMMRHDPVAATPELLELLRRATPATRPHVSSWPSAGFFAPLLVLVYLGGADARRELTDLLVAARELGYHDLAPVLDWYLDHTHTAPAR
ncbi:MAG: hypothetical protein R2761_17020 [Acidimicrobiales bacterium]